MTFTIVIAAAASSLSFEQQLILAAVALFGGGAAGAVVAARTQKNIEAKRIKREDDARFREARGAARRLAAQMADVRSTVEVIDGEWPERHELTLVLNTEDEELISVELPLEAWNAVDEARSCLKSVAIRSNRFPANAADSRKLLGAAKSQLEAAEALLRAFEQADVRRAGTSAGASAARIRTA